MHRSQLSLGAAMHFFNCLEPTFLHVHAWKCYFHTVSNWATIRGVLVRTMTTEPCSFFVSSKTVVTALQYGRRKQLSSGSYLKIP